jgi:hypothetical protein
MGYNKKLLDKTFLNILKLHNHSLTKKTNKSETARAFKFITKFNRIIHHSKLKKKKKKKKKKINKKKY